MGGPVLPKGGPGRTGEIEGKGSAAAGKPVGESGRKDAEGGAGGGAAAGTKDGPNYIVYILGVLAGAGVALKFAPPAEQQGMAILTVILAAALGVLTGFLLSALWRHYEGSSARLWLALVLVVLMLAGGVALGISYQSVGRRTILTYGNDKEQKQVIVGFHMNKDGEEYAKANPGFSATQILKAARGNAYTYWPADSIREATACLWVTASLLTFAAVTGVQLLTLVLAKNK